MDPWVLLSCFQSPRIWWFSYRKYFQIRTIVAWPTKIAWQECVQVFLVMIVASWKGGWETTVVWSVYYLEYNWIACIRLCILNDLLQTLFCFMYSWLELPPGRFLELESCDWGGPDFQEKGGAKTGTNGNPSKMLLSHPTLLRPRSPLAALYSMHDWMSNTSPLNCPPYPQVSKQSWHEGGALCQLWRGLDSLSFMWYVFPQ